MAKWPSLLQLAASNIDDVNAMWSGLGYYRRARMLLEAGAPTFAPDTPAECHPLLIHCRVRGTLWPITAARCPAPVSHAPSPAPRCSLPAAIAVPDLLKIPGIGPYTAGAIASIAFGQAAAIVDGCCTLPSAVCTSAPLTARRKRHSGHDEIAGMGRRHHHRRCKPSPLGSSAGMGDVRRARADEPGAAPLPRDPCSRVSRVCRSW